MIIAFRNVLLASFVIIVILSVFILVYTYFYMLPSDPLQKLSNVVLLYPLALLISWVPATSYGEWRDRYYTENDHYPNHSILVSNYLEASVCFYGPLISLIFYVYTKQARREWIRLYRIYIQRKTRDDDDDDNNDDDMRSTVSSITSKNDVIMNPIDDSITRISEGLL